MFTGLVEAVLRIRSLRRSGEGVRLRLECPRPWAGVGKAGGGEPLREGESVALNGVCLTVEALDPRGTWFEVAAVGETLSRTTVAHWRPGDRVHAERAIKAEERLGGHLVQGHVDCVGRISDRHRAGGRSLRLGIAVPRDAMRYVVEKGSVAIDGVSLTVARVSRFGFAVVLVPETLQRTLLGSYGVGQRVNVELDVLAKYAESVLGASGRG